MRLVSIPPPPGPHYEGGAQPPQFPHQGRPGPAPYGLYGPYGPRPPAAVNGVAIAALVLGLLCFLPAFGLVLGLIALRQIKRRGERGLGMAVTGIVMSSLGLVLWAVSLASGVAMDAWEGFRDGTSGNSVLSLRKGDCFTSPGGLEGWTTEVDRVPCAERHDGEVFALVTVPEGDFPGDDRLVDMGEDRCYELQDAYVRDSWALPGEVGVYYFAPSRQSWAFGDRSIACVLGREDASRFTGSLRRDETTLDAHQLAYLEAAEVLNVALDEVPGSDYPDDDVSDDREWAGQVEEALAEQIRQLRAHAWPAAAQEPVDDLIADLGKARVAWGKAADATDPDRYWLREEEAWELTDPAQSVTTREVLGLASSPPAYDEDAEREPEAGDMQV
ncbi:DUF4190 domain-containing protein [Streptomyces sp. NPDC005908]|uniref:DUF4190 domain-containing protein n=1 Tax=unclassified Streptomyces TaxID=2593676 RepID=UPI0011A5434A|nr:DUF4190 domain-containing protein [Streptomyces sp. T12]TWD21449.1 putative regulator of septum formation [Streptomyces sp. T12]